MGTSLQRFRPLEYSATLCRRQADCVWMRNQLSWSWRALQGCFEPQAALNFDVRSDYLWLIRRSPHDLSPLPVGLQGLPPAAASGSSSNELGTAAFMDLASPSERLENAEPDLSDSPLLGFVRSCPAADITVARPLRSDF